MLDSSIRIHSARCVGIKGLNILAAARNRHTLRGLALNLEGVLIYRRKRKVLFCIV